MESKKKIYLGLGIMAVAFLLACFLLVPFLIKQIKAASQDLIIQQQGFEKSQKEQQNIFHWKRQYQSSKQEIEKVANSFISQEKLLDFVLALENIAQKSGNRCEIYVAEQKTKELVISDEEGEKKENSKGESVEVVVFQVSLSGNFDGLVRFLAYLDNLSYLNEISSIQIQRINQENIEKGIRAGEISSVLNIRAYLNPSLR